MPALTTVGDVAVIGGGYAGMAAAVALCQRGISVSVFEAASVLGGRARRVDVRGLALDNGLHILIGAYRETLRLLSLVRAPNESTGLRRLPLELTILRSFHLKVPRLPAPFCLAVGLARASGLAWKDKWRIATLLQAVKSRRFRLERDVTVAQLLMAHGQTEASNRYLWHPLCTAALNTSPKEASAQMFANVLRDAFTGSRTNSDLLLPTIDLSELFPSRAARYISLRGGEVQQRSRVAQIGRDNDHFRLRLPDQERHFKAVIIAVGPQNLGSLVQSMPLMAAVTELINRLDYRSIYSVYLGYPDSFRLPKEMIGLDAQYVQWVFDRGRLCNQRGVLGVVISAGGDHEELSHGELAQKVHAELKSAFTDLPEPVWHQVIAEKRATFACTVDAKRPPAMTPVAGLFLAGDYVDSEYPATIEAAVRSGMGAADLVWQYLASKRNP